MPKNHAASEPATSTSEAAARGGGGGGRAEQVFLTPRVLDQGAFDAMAAELKGLIQDADGREQTLRQTTDEVKGFTGALRTALTEMQNRLERAGTVSPVLERWVVEARELTAQKIDTTRVSKETERVIGAIVEGRRAEFEHSVAPTVETLRQLRREMDRMKSSIESMLAGAEARVVSLEERARAAVDAMNQRAAAIEQASGERFATAEDRLAAVERRAAGLQHRMNSVVAQAEASGRGGAAGGAVRDAQALCVSIEAALEGSRRVEEITRLRLAELREVENLLGTLGGRVASLRAAAMQIPEIKPKGKREQGRDAA